MNKEGTYIIFIPTWNCNLKCPYCDYRMEGDTLYSFGNKRKIGRELNANDWYKALSKFDDVFLEMTGGEPTCYEDLHVLLRLGKYKWAITSNTLNFDAIKKLPTENCVSWTASYHFHSDEQFNECLWLLSRKGRPARVTIVFTPGNYLKAIEKIKHFSNSSYCGGVNIHPLLKKEFNWNKHPEIYSSVKSLADGRRIIFIDDIEKEWNPKRFDLCRAGTKDYLCVMPDGKVLRCYSQILTESDEGSIFDYQFKEDFSECKFGCMFPCDISRVQKKTKEGENYVL